MGGGGGSPGWGGVDGGVGGGVRQEGPVCFTPVFLFDV